MNILASTISLSNGPTGWVPRNVDWDGDRTTDEVFNTIGGLHTIFRLEPSTGTNCLAGSVPDPITGPWVHPYRWSFVAHTASPSNHFDTMGNNLALDFFGDSREEIVVPGAGGLFVVYNPAVNPLAGLHPSPWRSEPYRRRFVGNLNRTVDYQALPRLVRVEVQPATWGLQPTQSRSYAAIGHYSDGSSADVTAHASWTSGNAAVASFAGSLLTANAAGVAAIRATVAGVRNDDAGLAMVSTALEPRVLYAGWADTYLRAGLVRDLVMEVRVADAQNDVVGVAAAIGGQLLPGLSFVDDGTAGDRVASDGTWTAFVPNVTGPPPTDFYVEAIGLDSALRFSSLWPYLAIPAGSTATPIPGFPLFPFASEVYGGGPFLAGTGILSGSVTPSAGGTLHVVARVRDPSVGGIATFLAGANLGLGMNDQGNGADQLAGDGLWTLSVTIPPNSPSGRYVIEHLGFDAIPRVSDAYPRLRSHL